MPFPALLAGMNAVQGLQLALGAVSIYQGMKAGAAAAGTAEQQAKQMEIDGITNEAQAIQNMNQRVEEYDNAMASNEAAFGLINRNPEDLVDFKDEEKRVLMRDLKTLKTQRELDKGQTKIASMVEVQRGKNAQRSAIYQAIGTGINTMIKYQTYKT